MNAKRQPQGAATPPQAAPPAAPPSPEPTGKLGVLKAKVDSIGAIITVIAGAGGLLAAGAATGSGYVTSAYDWLTSTSQTQSQVTALDERLKVLEGGKEALEKDRAEIARIALALKATTDDLSATGVDVSGLRAVQDELRLKVARMDVVLCMLTASAKERSKCAG